MELVPKIFIKNIKERGNIPNVMAVIGEDGYYRQKVADSLVEAVFKDVPESDREIYRFNQDTDFVKVEQAVNSYPFFCSRNLVIIADEKLFEKKGNAKDDGLAKRLEPLLPLVDNIPDYCTLLFNVPKFNKTLKLFKNIRDKGVVVEAEPLKPANLAPWLKTAAEERGGKFDSSGIIRIMEYLAPADTVPLDLLDKEIDKLVLFAGTNRAWTARDVEEVFSDLPQLGVFKLTEAIAQHKLLQAIRYLRTEQKKTGSRGEPIIGQLLWKLRMLIRVMELQQAGMNPKEMEKHFPDIKNPGWQIRNTLASLKGFEMPRLTRAFRELGRVNGDARTYGFSQDRIFDRIEEIIVGLLDVKE